MKQKLAFIFALLGWFAIVAQYFLMFENRTTPILETNIRFFSFFTILTNILVALYFSFQSVSKSKSIATNSNSTRLTALTVYITIVGLVYQILLRSSWNPKGLQMIVNELLHSVIPILVILFWYLYESKSELKYKHITQWLFYPIIYLVYILTRGYFSNFYPYPFVNVTTIGIKNVLINSGLLLIVFVLIAAIFIRIGKYLK